MTYHVNFFKNKKAQLKIQQMAFVLVALVIFFAIVSLFYFSFSIKDLKDSAGSLEGEKAKELVRKLASTPEFAYTSSGCLNCLDLDKLFVLKDRSSYNKFWDLDFLQIEKVFPHEKEECTRANYPNCRTITLIKNQEIGSPSSAFVSICFWNNEKGGYQKCELGRIYASGKNLNK